MDMIKAMIYGIVEGITEWLPISSTGHMILLERLLSFQGVGEDFFNVFDVVIQLGAIMAVVVLFWKQIWPFGLVPKEPERNYCKKRYLESVAPDIGILYAGSSGGNLI